MTDQYTALEEKIGIAFGNKKLIFHALTHRSALNDHYGRKLHERLEFLGDDVIELVATEHLLRMFPKADEGELTTIRSALVNNSMLARVAEELELKTFLIFPDGIQGTVMQRILANTFEALVGALYTDLGLGASKGFLRRRLMPKIEEIIAEGLHRDPKSVLQAEAQSVLGITPTYRILDEEGPAHSRHFAIGVYLNGSLFARGEGSSKKEAEIHAATMALQLTGWGARGQEIENVIRSLNQLDYRSALARARMKRQKSGE